MLSVNQIKYVILTCIPYSDSINLRKAAFGIIAENIDTYSTNIVLEIKQRILWLAMLNASH
jgi:hypothetical protein